MAPNSLNVLLIEDAVDFAELVQHWLTEGDNAGMFCLNWTDTLVGGLNRLARGDVDLILLDLGLPDSSGLETFVKTQAHAAGIPIIILSAADSETLALQMIQDGAADYLVKNTCSGSALVRAVRYAVVRHRSHADTGSKSSSERKMVGVVGAKGGVGATTVACHLALELQRQTAQKVLLADLDLNAGLVPMRFGIEPKYSLLDAIQNIRRLDQTYWQSLVTAAGELDVLPSPGLAGGQEISADAVRQVFTLVHPSYDWTVLDLARLNGVVMRLLDRFSDLLIVTGYSLASLYETKRVSEALLRAGISHDRLRLVFNEVREEPRLSGAELNRTFGIPVFAALRFDPQEIDDGKQTRMSASETQLCRQIRGLARKLAGLPPMKSAPGVRRWLALADHFRRTGKMVAETD